MSAIQDEMIKIVQKRIINYLQKRKEAIASGDQLAAQYYDVILKADDKVLADLMSSKTFSAHLHADNIRTVNEIANDIDANYYNSHQVINKLYAYISSSRSSPEYPVGYYKVLSFTPRPGDARGEYFVALSKTQVRPKPGYKIIRPFISSAVGTGKILTKYIIADFEIENPTVLEIKDCFASPKEIIEEYRKTGKAIEIKFSDLLSLFESFNNPELYDDELTFEYFGGDNYADKILRALKGRCILVFAKGATMPTAEVAYDKATDSYDVAFRYHKGEWDTVSTVITLIKGTVAVANRAYDPATKTWSFAADVYKKIVEPIFVTVKIAIVVKQPANTVGPENFFYEHAVKSVDLKDPAVLGAQLCKLLGVNDELLKDDIGLKKAYRKKALELHPDRNNGDGSKMSELNEVWNAYTAT